MSQYLFTLRVGPSVLVAGADDGDQALDMMRDKWPEVVPEDTTPANLECHFGDEAVLVV